MCGWWWRWWWLQTLVESTLLSDLGREWSFVGESITSAFSGVADASHQLLSSMGGRPAEEAWAARLFRCGMALETALDRAPHILQLATTEVRAHDGAP